MNKLAVIATSLVVLAGVSVGTFIYVKNDQLEKSRIESENVQDYQLFNFTFDDVTTIEFDCPDGFFVVESIDSTWALTNSDEFLINQDYAINVASYMSELTANKDFGLIADADLSLYGLDDPTVISCQTTDNSYTIYMGDATPTNEAYYCMIEGKDKIYSIESSYGSVLCTNKYFLKSGNLLAYTSSNQVTDIKLTRGDEEIYNISKNVETDLWEFIGDYSYLQVDNSAVNSMLSVLTRLKAEAFIEENFEDYSKYDFDEPFAKLEVSGNDGKTYSLLFSYYDDDPNYVYVLLENSKQVSKYYAFDVDYVEGSILDMVVNQIYSTDISTVTGLDINYKGQEIDIDIIDSANSEYQVDGFDVNEYGETAVYYFTSFYNALSNLTFAEIDIDAEPIGEPEVTINYSLTDDSEIKMEFIPIDETKYWLKINDTYTTFILSERQLSGTDTIMYFYEKLMKQISTADM